MPARHPHHCSNPADDLDRSLLIALSCSAFLLGGQTVLVLATAICLELQVCDLVPRRHRPPERNLPRFQHRSPAKVDGALHRDDLSLNPIHMLAVGEMRCWFSISARTSKHAELGCAHLATSAASISSLETPPVISFRRTHDSDRAPEDALAHLSRSLRGEADPRPCRSPRASARLCMPPRWPPRRVVNNGGRTSDRAAGCGRGVAVELFVSEVADQFVVQHAQSSYYEELLNAGVRIYLYPQPTVLHAKFFTVDDVAGVIGSSNMDYRSFGLDYEISLMGTDPSFVADLQQISDDYRAVCRELTAEEWKRRPAAKRYVDNVMRLLSALQ